MRFYYPNFTNDMWRIFGLCFFNDVKIGAFMDISELVKTASPDLYAFIPEDYWEACKVGGKLYAVPTYKDSSQTEYVVWDKELMDSIGFDGSTVKDLSDLTAPLTAIKETTLPSLSS